MSLTGSPGRRPRLRIARPAVRLGRPWRRITRAQATHPAETFVPVDPRVALGPDLDPDLLAIRSLLRPHGRRLWLRRVIRRVWIVVAGAVVAQLALWTLARLMPVEVAPTLSLGILLLAGLVLLVLAVSSRPSLGETAIAVDREGGLGDRAASALALAVAFPDVAVRTPNREVADDAPPIAGSESDPEAERRRFVRRQRRDTLGALRATPSSLFRPRFSRRPAAIAFVAVLALAPVLLLPNVQDAAIAQARQVREEAKNQAERLDDLADVLEQKGANADDPRTRLAQELRDLARQLRENPNQLDANLAKLGAIEAALRAQLDPANEQRAAALSSLSRSLSRAATGKAEANPDGDPKQAEKDLHDVADKVDEMTPDEQKELARKLTELEGAASQAGGAASQALRDAAQSLAQGDTHSAQAALDRLGDALSSAQDRVATNRDLTSAANQLQDARRDLANA
ncbi:MAG TPA: hypothetical protein VM451_07730, partial [Candidatus Limnocylindria bacterium]|nr:hypothetical protein [Candidatus Limnocylindria bacterium]